MIRALRLGGSVPILQRKLLREILLNAGITFGVITAVLIIGGALRVLHQADFVTLPTFLQGVVFFLAKQLDKTLPMTVLVAVVTTYGRASAENEINAMRAAGIHLYFALVPALVFGALSAAIVLFVNDRVAPRLTLNAASVLQGGLGPAIQAMGEKGERCLNLGKRQQLIFRDVDEHGNLLDVRFKKYRKADEGASPLEMELAAKVMRIDVIERRQIAILRMLDVTNLVGNAKEAAVAAMDWPISLKDEGFEKNLPQQSLAELVASEHRETADTKKKDRRAAETEFHKRIASAFACLLFVLVGVPLAIIFRHGNRMVAFLIAFLIALVVYYPTFILGELLAKEADNLPTWIAIWSGSIVLAGLGAALVRLVFRR